MFGIRAKTTFRKSGLKQAMDRVSYRAIKEALFDIRAFAMASIKSAPRGKSSPPGQPPHTRRSRKKGGVKGRGRLPQSITYFADPDGLGGVVGPRFTIMGTAGGTLEFGGRRKGQEYPERPFMGPALRKVAPKLPWYWQAKLR
ncbi:hypothetical protein LCGC14_1308670 [marine sediment metagenome]|uniref:HK97 gp10 family phage protein n=1 Tax=marine sediment metagenome TaxID=412755 RepID=A0A0F9L7W6_9ZZZZ